MFSNGESELHAAIRGRSAAVKRDIQCACDAAFLRLREKERQLLRVVDLVASRQQGDLWAAGLLRQQQQAGGDGPSPPPAVQTMSLSLDTELLSRAIQQFATVRLDGLVTSSVGVTSSSLPDGLEEYGAEEHLVSHKPLPGIPGSVRVTRPPPLAGYQQFYPDRHVSCESSLTSGDEEDKFEMIDDMMPGKIFRSDPIDIIKDDRCGCAHRPTSDIEDLSQMDSVTEPAASLTSGGEKTDPASGEKTDPASGEKLTASAVHPLQGCKEAWLLPRRAGPQNSVVPSPFAQWHATMSSNELYIPTSASSTTNAPATSPTRSPAAERQYWLLRQVCRANEPCQTAADCVSDCAEQAAKLSLGDWRSEWLLGGGDGGMFGGGRFERSTGFGGLGFGGFDGGSDLAGGSGFDRRVDPACVGAGGCTAVIPEDGNLKDLQPGLAPDLLAPFRQMENNTSWVSARG